ncbi:MAG: type I-E CRISPR-associated protein Cas5/CasD [Myxococcales bacterium]|jgi:CRISPR system Cascade subunit CasD
MTRFLVFRLWGPMTAWGDVAVGERRPAFAHPTRSATLGLVGAALGLRRDSPELAQLERGYGYACRVDSPGVLLSDFHTAERARASAARKNPPRSRKEELALELDHPVVSRRDYYCDALAAACLWPLDGESPFDLETLADALKRPRFTPYLGRKSCPLGMPLQPQIVEAADPAAAIDAARFADVEMLAPVLRGAERRGTYRWEGEWPRLRPEQTVRRRDQARSRVSWQFVERVEHVAQRRRSADVAEQS